MVISKVQLKIKTMVYRRDSSWASKRAGVSASMMGLRMECVKYIKKLKRKASM